MTDRWEETLVMFLAVRVVESKTAKVHRYSSSHEFDAIMDTPRLGFWASKTKQPVKLYQENTPTPIFRNGISAVGLQNNAPTFCVSLRQSTATDNTMTLSSTRPQVNVTGSLLDFCLE